MTLTFEPSVTLTFEPQTCFVLSMTRRLAIVIICADLFVGNPPNYFVQCGYEIMYSFMISNLQMWLWHLRCGPGFCYCPVIINTPIKLFQNPLSECRNTVRTEGHWAVIMLPQAGSTKQRKPETIQTFKVKKISGGYLNCDCTRKTFFCILNWWNTSPDRSY